MGSGDSVKRKKKEKSLMLKKDLSDTLLNHPPILDSLAD